MPSIQFVGAITNRPAALCRDLVKPNANSFPLSPRAVNDRPYTRTKGGFYRMLVTIFLLSARNCAIIYKIFFSCERSDPNGKAFGCHRWTAQCGQVHAL